MTMAMVASITRSTNICWRQVKIICMCYIFMYSQCWLHSAYFNIYGSLKSVPFLRKLKLLQCIRSERVWLAPWRTGGPWLWWRDLVNRSLWRQTAGRSGNNECAAAACRVSYRVPSTANTICSFDLQTFAGLHSLRKIVKMSSNEQKCPEYLDIFAKLNILLFTGVHAQTSTMGRIHHIINWIW